MATYPAGGWLPPGAHFDWQRADQGRDFVTDWQGIVQAPGAGVCVGIGSDRPFPNGFGSRYALVRIDEGAFAGHRWYIGHCTALVSPGEHFAFGHPLARADQGHNFEGTSGGWVELGNQQADGSLGPFNANGHWFDAPLRKPLIRGDSMGNGADTIKEALGLLPPGLDVYASYVDNFGGYDELLLMREQLNPNAIYFSYTIFGGPAHFADVEPGAMHPSDLPHWLANVGIPLPGNTVPGVYTSAGNADAVFAAAGENIPHDQLPSKFVFQSAHYGAGPHICGPGTCGFRQAHGTQWDNAGPQGQNFDRALWAPGVLGQHTPPLPEGTMSISATMNPRGHLEVFVHLQDGSVKHIWQTSDFEWVKNDKGETVWYPLGTPPGK